MPSLFPSFHRSTSPSSAEEATTLSGALLDPTNLSATQNAQLSQYRLLVGIHSSPSLTKADPSRPTRRIGHHQRPTRNEGLYRRVMNEEHRATTWYYAAATIVNTSLMFQILIAASITALGAAGTTCTSFRAPVTVLGAVNTVLAGVLAYVKGQGLPNRMVQYRSQMRAVREFIEFRERQFEAGVVLAGRVLDAEVEAAAAQAMYEDARRDEENNFPDTYSSTAQQARVNGAQPEGKAGVASGVVGAPSGDDGGGDETVGKGELEMRMTGALQPQERAGDGVERSGFSKQTARDLQGTVPPGFSGATTARVSVYEPKESMNV